MPCTTAIADATLSESSFYVGINLQSILYGAYLSFYLRSMQIFLARRRQRWKSDMFYAIFSSVMLVLVTIRITTEAVYGQKMWLLDRNYLGGPVAYGKAHASDVYMELGAVAVVILQLMTGAFMIHRCRIVWDSLRAVVIPSILWLVNLALGILVRMPWIAFSNDIPTKLGLTYNVISVLLNAILTCMIWYRLVCYATTVKECHGGHLSPYFTTEALVVESMPPYTLCGITLLISYGVGSKIGIALSSVYSVMMCISTQMLILRVIEGKAWRRDVLGSTKVFSAERSGKADG